MLQILVTLQVLLQQDASRHAVLSTAKVRDHCACALIHPLHVWPIT